MKTLRLLLSFALLLFTISSAMQPAMAQPPSTPKDSGPLVSTGTKIYLSLYKIDLDRCPR